jgi:hypothetical protein
VITLLRRPTRLAKVEARARLAEGASPKVRIKENEEETIPDPKTKRPRASPRQRGGKKGGRGPGGKVVVKKEESGDSFRIPCSHRDAKSIACDVSILNDPNLRI